MKKLLAVVALLWIVPLPLRAQLDNSIISQFRVNFAIPDAPAFEVLGTEPGQILRPVSVRELTASFSDFRSSGSVIPQAFATEFSPAMLIGGPGLSLDEYQDNPALYRLRLSAATHRGADTARTLLGLGVRVNVIDRADPRTDRELVRAITSVLAQINNVYAEQLAAPPLPPNPESGVVNREMLSPDRRAQVEQLEGQIKALRELHKKQNWNAPSLDVAYAFRASTADSLGNDPRVDAHSVWATYATNFGDWNQLLLGAKGGIERGEFEEDYGETGSVAARMYAGTNDYKMFAELQLAHDRDDDTDLLLHGGGEVALPYSLWGNVAVGLEQVPGRSGTRLVTRFSLKTGLPAAP